MRNKLNVHNKFKTYTKKGSLTFAKNDVRASLCARDSSLTS